MKIGHAVVDENGKARGGKAGDQTKKEIRIQEWYDKPWGVYLECIDPLLSTKAAALMEQICAGDFGYDQGERTSGYTAILANGNKVKGAKGEFDCSSLVSTCYKLAGLNISVNNTTRTLRKALLGTGKFVAYTDPAHLKSDTLAKRGGIYLTEGAHVVMTLG